MRKNKLKRIYAFLLSCIFSFSCVMFNTQSVLANLQSHVKDVVIRALPQTGNATNINLTWTNPPWSNLVDGEAQGGDLVHAPDGFRIRERNLTAGEGTFNNLTEAGPNDTTATISRVLATGSLYM